MIAAAILLGRAYMPKVLLPQCGTLSKRAGLGIVGLAAVCIAATLTYGWWTISQPLKGNPIRVSVVQGNIAQSIKWDNQYSRFIISAQ